MIEESTILVFEAVRDLPPLPAGTRSGSHWWQCRYCRRGETGLPNVNVEADRALAHMARCPDRPDGPLSDSDRRAITAVWGTES